MKNFFKKIKISQPITEVIGQVESKKQTSISFLIILVSIK